MRRGIVSVTVLLAIALAIGMYAKFLAWKERSDAWMQFQSDVVKERADAGDRVTYTALHFGRDILPAGRREVFQYRRGKLAEAAQSSWREPQEPWHALHFDIQRDLVHAEMQKRGTRSERAAQDLWKEEPAWKRMGDIFHAYSELHFLVDSIRFAGTPSREEDAAKRAEFKQAKERLDNLLAQK
ncbi:MAG: hypothetical protein G01um101425_837 [Candidatus Peregrinibacteria bacterium Gr01-1014_25]|nr:MAG: hypothetical protein G01um101425_837 [Candidatus Peregrinibacteria bacterium Gr01-1014_25]